MRFLEVKKVSFHSANRLIAKLKTLVDKDALLMEAPHALATKFWAIFNGYIWSLGAFN